MHEDYYNTSLGDGVYLYSVLFEPECSVQLDRDLKERLSTALDRIDEFDDTGLSEYDSQFGGSTQFAPGVAWAHGRCSAGHQVAVLPLPLGGTPNGRVPVVVDGVTNEIAFVTGEDNHLDFFRSVIQLENADEAAFERLAPSAFPALEWADDIWRGLRDFSRNYYSVRCELTRYLGGLNDHGAKCFYEHKSGDPRHLSQFLSASVGTETSDENGNTKRNPSSKRDRTRRHHGVSKVFWWHVKLQPHIDRIYFLYESPPSGLPQSSYGRIVVGLFKDHGI